MKTALLIIDIQNDYFEEGSNPLTNAKQACENARLVLDSFRKKNQPVIHIQHLSLRPGATFFIPNTRGAEIHSNVRPLDNEKVITKNYPNGFRETELLEYLKLLDIKELVVCGMMTHMCVEATVRAAKDFGFICTLVEDACATKDLEIKGKIVHAADVHTSFVAALAYFYATVVSTPDFLEVWK